MRDFGNFSIIFVYIRREGLLPLSAASKNVRLEFQLPGEKQLQPKPRHIFCGSAYSIDIMSEQEGSKHESETSLLYGVSHAACI